MSNRMIDYKGSIWSAIDGPFPTIVKLDHLLGHAHICTIYSDDTEIDSLTGIAARNGSLFFLDTASQCVLRFEIEQLKNEGMAETPSDVYFPPQHLGELQSISSFNDGLWIAGSRGIAEWVPETDTLRCLISLPIGIGIIEDVAVGSNGLWVISKISRRSFHYNFKVGRWVHEREFADHAPVVIVRFGEEPQYVVTGQEWSILFDSQVFGIELPRNGLTIRGCISHGQEFILLGSDLTEIELVAWRGTLGTDRLIVKHVLFPLRHV